MMKIPYHKQETKFTCGPACMRMVLHYFGKKRNEKQLARLMHTNKIIGTKSEEFPKIAEKYKFSYVVNRHSSVNDIKKLMKEKHIVIVRYFYRPEKVDHDAVVRKIDKKYIYFYDPFFGPEHRYSLTHFMNIWHCRKEKRWLFAAKK